MTRRWVTVPVNGGVTVGVDRQNIIHAFTYNLIDRGSRADNATT
jgi:hypothetical protein